jgi:hypothetical protein
MASLFLVALLVTIVIILAAVMRSRRKSVSVFPADPVSTLHSERSKKVTKETQAALDAATRLLR